MHNTTIIIGTMDQDLTRSLLIKIVLFARLDVCLMDFDILIPGKNVQIFKLSFQSKEIFSNLSGLDCS